MAASWNLLGLDMAKDEKVTDPSSSTLNQNHIFHYTRCITLKTVTSLRDPPPRQCALATQLLSKKCCNGGEPLATPRPI